MSRDSNNSEGTNSNPNLLVGGAVALLIAVGGIVMFVMVGDDSEPLPTATLPPAPPTSASVVCHVAGTVYNQDNEPLAQVDVLIDFFGDHLATTDPDGRFEADCSWVNPSDFPIRLQLTHLDWSSSTGWTTDEYINLGETQTAVNLYVPDDRIDR